MWDAVTELAVADFLAEGKSGFTEEEILAYVLQHLEELQRRVIEIACEDLFEAGHLDRKANPDGSFSYRAKRRST